MAMVAAVGRVIGRSTSIFFSSLLPIFLLLSLLLLSFRSSAHLSTLSLISFLDRDPSVHSLLSRLSNPPASPLRLHRGRQFPNLPLPPPQPPRRHHHVLHSSRLAALDNDDDVFSDTGLHAVSHRRPPRLRSHNSSFLLVGVGGNGLLSFPESLRVQKVKLWVPSPSPVLIFSADSSPSDKRDKREGDREDRSPVGFQIFGQEFDLDRRDVVTLFYLACIFSAAHAYAVIGFLLSYSIALGVVYFAATGALLRKRSSFWETIYSGSRLGIRRLPVLLFLRWSLRDALTQFLCIIFFSEIKDQYSLLKLFVKVKLMPFMLTSPPPSIQFARDDASLNGFLIMWTLLDTAIAIVFAVDCWVAIMERQDGRPRRRSGREVVKEGCFLVSVMARQAFLIKSLEVIFCGKFGTRVMTVIGGTVSSMVFQSVAEVYFMVVWLMFYFAARCKAGEADVMRFGWRELEDSFNDLR